MAASGSAGGSRYAQRYAPEPDRPRRGVVDFRRNDVIRLRKPHACGENEWEIVRLGADIGLHCLKCSHRILLSRSDLERRLTSFVRRDPALEPPTTLDDQPPTPD